MSTTVGSNIIRLREERGLSQKDLAEALDVTRQAVSQWETGWSSPRMGMVEKLAAFFHVSKSEIIEPRVDYALVQLEDDESELVRLFRTMTDEDRAALLHIARGMVRK